MSIADAMRHDQQITPPVFAVPAKGAAIAQIDALRTPAMLSIFVQHLWLSVIPNPETTLQKILRPIFTEVLR